MMIDSRRADTEHSGEAAHGELLPPLVGDETPRCGEDLRTGCDGWSPSPRRIGCAAGHECSPLTPAALVQLRAAARPRRRVTMAAAIPATTGRAARMPQNGGSTGCEYSVANSMASASAEFARRAMTITAKARRRPDHAIRPASSQRRVRGIAAVYTRP